MAEKPAPQGVPEAGASGGTDWDKFTTPLPFKRCLDCGMSIAPHNPDVRCEECIRWILSRGGAPFANPTERLAGHTEDHEGLSA